MNIVHRAEEKLSRGLPLSREELLELWALKDLNELGRLAHMLRTLKNQMRTYYALNRHVNYTNVCQNRCLFCAFRREYGQNGAYILRPEEIVAELKKTPEMDEIHVVGACHPEIGLDYYITTLRQIKEAFPKVGIKGLTAVEVAHVADKESLKVNEVLSKLREAGLNALAGGGAEILKDEIRAIVCPQKISSEAWLQIHREAHMLGLKSNATMLFGHVEGIEDRVDHLLRLRRLQEETGGFMAFVPIPFLPKNTAMEHVPGPDAVDMLKTIALSRIALHNFGHIKAYWVMMGTKLASLALWYGADDLEGTVMGERIGKEAGGSDSQGMKEAQIKELICQAGFLPVKRAVLY